MARKLSSILNYSVAASINRPRRVISSRELDQNVGLGARIRDELKKGSNALLAARRLRRPRPQSPARAHRSDENRDRSSDK